MPNGTPKAGEEHDGIRRMSGPSSPRGWLNFAVSVADSYRRPYSPRLEYTGWMDRRISDRRESALSVLKMAEKSCNGNGGGKLLMAFFCEDASWHSFTETEQYHLRKTIRHFARELREAGFLPREDKEIVP
jgi:hypothetical protein